MGHLSRVVFIIGLCLALLGCEKKSTPIYHSEIEAKDGSPVYVLSEMRDIISVVENNFDGEEGEIVFNGKDARDLFTPGDVLVSAPTDELLYGLLCKVKSIKTEGDNTVVVAEPATLEEVIEEGEASGEYSVVDLVDSVEGDDGTVVEIADDGTRADLNSGISVTFVNKKLADVDGVDISVSGKVKIDGKLHLDYKFDDWTLVASEFWAQLAGSIKIELDASAKGNLPLFEKRLFRMRLKPIKFAIGYVPIVIVPYLDFWIKPEINGEITLGCELADINGQIKLGAVYSKDRGWESINDVFSSSHSVLKNWKYFDMQGELRFNFRTCLLPTFYGYEPKNKNFLFTIDATNVIKLQMSDFTAMDLFEGYFNPKLKVSWALEYKVKSPYFTPVSKWLPGFEVKGKFFEYVVLDKHLFPQYSALEKQDLGGGCVRIYYSMTDLDDCLFTNLKEYGVYWKKGKWSNHKKDGTEHRVSLGSINLDDIMPDALHRHYDFTVDLIETEYDQTYTAWPYCVDRTFEIEHNADVSVFKVSSKEETDLRSKLIQFYYDTDGPHWLHQDNWCSDKPLEDWYGVYKHDAGYTLQLHSNRLLGSASLADCDQLLGVDLLSTDPQNPNFLFSLDVSRCTSLWSFHVSDLNSLNASGCISLMNLTLSTEEPLNVDVSGCTSLESLSLSKMRSLILDVSGCSSLRTFKLNNCGSVSLIGSIGSSLESLNLHACSMQSLDISNCPSLKTVDCTDNSMTSLKVSNCSSLESLYCSRNALSSLDIKDCPSVTYLDCSYNELTSLDVKRIPSLAELNCNNNKLSSLDVSGMSRLRLLSCGTNKLSSLNYSGCGELRELYCFENRLTLLNLSVCPKLEMLGCSDNLLTALDVSVCPEMWNLACENNHIIQQIEYEDSFGVFGYDQLYNYTYDEQGIMVSYSKNPYGWYFPGEPDICGHYRKTN